ncbi:MAG TPA: hypothetical protein VNI58_03190 [Mariprofundaceae bacterium]|nr:hypothetical protein [Mariprofundaceae bacterium]
MSDVLHWRNLHLGAGVVDACQVGRGQHVRLVLESVSQVQFMDRMLTLPEDGSGDWPMWLESGAGRFQAGTQEFVERIGIMIRHRGLMANLTMRENLLLPFLYQGDKDRLEEAFDEVGDVADFVGLTALLHEQAGERSAYTHALVSLGRCLLARPDIIVAQEVHIGMSPERLAHFRELSVQALQRLGSGLVYVTSSMNEGSGVIFSRTLTVQPEAGKLSGGEE